MSGREDRRERHERWWANVDNGTRYGADRKPSYGATAARTSTASARIKASNQRRATIARLAMRRKATP